MRRIHNNTISCQNILEIKEQAQRLFTVLHEIDFCMTMEEQEGLYSIIRNLEFETWHERFATSDPRPSDVGVQSEKLRRLMSQITHTDDNGNSAPAADILSKIRQRALDRRSDDE